MPFPLFVVDAGLLPSPQKQSRFHAKRNETEISSINQIVIWRSGFKAFRMSLAIALFPCGLLATAQTIT
jgi:hypothetical protein